MLCTVQLKRNWFLCFFSDCVTSVPIQLFLYFTFAYGFMIIYIFMFSFTSYFSV